MRILMSIHHSLNADSGAPGATLRLANALRRRGHVVNVFSFERAVFPGKLKGLLYPWLVAAFVASQARYDVLDLSSGDGWILSILPRAFLGRSAPLLIARSHGLEHVMHEARLEESKASGQKLSWKYPIYHGGFRLWECRISFSHADATLFLNEAHLRYAIEHLGVSPERAIRVRNGIAEHFLERAKALMAATPQSESPQGVAFIGRYEEMKGSRYLGIAMREILAANPSARLGLFGAMIDPSMVLADYPAELRSRIFVMPTYRNEDLPRLLEGYHVLAFPSLSEGFAVAPLEAMACGLVPIVTALSGPTSYVENERNGIVVKTRDANDLERAIAALLSDTSRWNALRRRSLATAAQYSWAAVAAETETIYELRVAPLRRDHATEST
jgi:glycosyltransferase involved in cell wall biosynthesis